MTRLRGNHGTWPVAEKKPLPVKRDIKPPKGGSGQSKKTK